MSISQVNTEGGACSQRGSAPQAWCRPFQGLPPMRNLSAPTLDDRGRLQREPHGNLRQRPARTQAPALGSDTPGLLLQRGPRAGCTSLPKGTATRPPHYGSPELVLTAPEEVKDKGGRVSSRNQRSHLGPSWQFSHFLAGPPLPPQTSENHPGGRELPLSPRGSRGCALALAFC